MGRAIAISLKRAAADRSLVLPPPEREESPSKDPYAENFEEDEVEGKKKPKRKPKEPKAPKEPKPAKEPKEKGAKREKKEKEPKEPKKRGRKPTVHYDDGGNPVEKESKPKRQYNRKKKPVPGAMAEDDLESVVIPQDPSTYLPATLENGDSQASTDLAEQAKAEGEEEEEATPAKPQPRVKSKTPSRVKPSKTLLQFA